MNEPQSSPLSTLSIWPWWMITAAERFLQEVTLIFVTRGAAWPHTTTTPILPSPPGFASLPSSFSISVRCHSTNWLGVQFRVSSCRPPLKKVLCKEFRSSQGTRHDPLHVRVDFDFYFRHLSLYKETLLKKLTTEVTPMK